MLNKLWNVKYTIQSITGVSHKAFCCYTRFIICVIRRLWVLVGNQLDAQFLLLYVYLNYTCILLLYIIWIQNFVKVTQDIE